MSALKFAAACGAAAPLYVDDVFSAYTYTGNGSTQTITNGIDLAGKGGMVWMKHRASVQNHQLSDTVNGMTFTSAKFLRSNLDSAIANNGADFQRADSNGFTWGVNANDIGFNLSGGSYISWTFRKAPKFFDVVTYTGNGANRTIAHSLGSVPGMIMVKRTDVAGSWMVYHNSIANTENLVLNTTAAKVTNATAWNSTTATASVFSLGTHADVNTNAGTYVAYLFAHDTAADGIIQCGSFTTDGSGNATVNLGWEPQYLMYKPAIAGNWFIADTIRGWINNGAGDGDALLMPNLSNAESTPNQGNPTSTGISFIGIGANQTYIYLAIRRPNKPPTVGTQVYNAIARTGTGAAATVTGVGFPPDLVMVNSRTGVAGASFNWDRLRGPAPYLDRAGPPAEVSAPTSVLSFNMDGISIGTDTNNIINYLNDTYINWFFRRAPGVFDSSCDTGTGVAKTESHNLGAVPELMIRKGRSGATQWEVYFAALGNTQKLILNSTAAAATDTTAWNSTTPTASVFTVGTGANVNTSAATYVTYTAASLSGISKIGTYTGNGGTQTINCGFAAGARFILIKASSTTGAWTVIDSVRGIIAGSDPYLLLNSTAAEVTSEDCVDPDSSGFIVNTTTAALNTNAVVYQYWAIA